MDCRRWKKVLILRNTGCLGDETAFSCVYRELKKANPGLNISVFAYGNSAVFLKENRYVDNLYVGKFRHLRRFQRWPTMIYLGIKLASHKYDAVLDLHEWKQKNWVFMRSLASRFKYKAANFLSAEKKHYSEHLSDFLKALGISCPDTSYDLPLVKESQERVAGLTGGEPYIVLNPFGSSKARIFTDETLSILISVLRKTDSRQIIIPYIPPPSIGSKNKYLLLRRKPKADGGNVKLFATQTPFDLIALIHKSDLVISPDTAAVHIAEAWHKKTIAFYTNPDTSVWLPKNPAARIIKTDPADVNKFDLKEFERICKENV